MILWFLLIVVIAWIVYGPLADFLFHICHIGSIYRGDELRREITLTFDDGPDPVYTPQLLDLLEEHHARAVFFVVGETAAKYPELIRAMHARGHLIGSHTQHHPNAWFVSPLYMRRELVKSKQLLEEIIQSPVVYFRPPWGRFNLFLVGQLRAIGWKPVLWTFSTRDWRKGDRTHDIAQTIASKIYNGAIVLLHDSGGATGSSQNTLSALRIILPRLRQIGFSLDVGAVTGAQEAALHRRVKLRRLSQRIVRPVWHVWDRLYSHFAHVYPMTKIFRLNVGKWHFGPRYAGPNQAADGGRAKQPPSPKPGMGDFVAAPSEPLLHDGVPLLELHMQIVALQDLIKIESPEKMAVRTLREVRDSLRGIAQAMIYDDRYRTAQGVFGYTLMHRGIEKLGFHVEAIAPTLGNRWIAFLTKTIMVLHHPQGRKRLKAGLEDMELRLVWMTRAEVLARYMDTAEPVNVPTVAQLLEHHVS